MTFHAYGEEDDNRKKIMDDYVIDGDLTFSDMRSALKFYQEQYHKKKEWVGLTDDEKHGAVWSGGEFGDGMLWAEKLLKERNT